MWCYNAVSTSPSNKTILITLILRGDNITTANEDWEH